MLRASLIIFGWGVLMTGCSTPPPARLVDGVRYFERDVLFGETTREHEGMELTLSMPVRLVEGAPVPLVLKLANRSDTVSGYFIPFQLHPAEYFKLEVTQNDAPAAMTEAGETLLRPLMRGGGPSNSLPPGDADTWHINLRELFELTPGQYELTGQVRGVTTAPLRFVVGPDPYGRRARVTGDEDWNFFVESGDRPGVRFPISRPGQ